MATARSTSRASNASSGNRFYAGRQQPTNYTVGIDLGQKQWNLKELARMDLRRAQVATGANGCLQIPCKPMTGGNTFGIPYSYQWVYTQPSRVEDRALAVAQWPGMLRLEEAATIPVKGLGQNNAMGIRLVNRSPRKLDGGGDGGPEDRAAQGGVGGLSVFRAAVAPQSLEEYVQDKRSALVKENLSSNHTGSPRLRLAFKEGLLCPVQPTPRIKRGGNLTYGSSLKYLASEGLGQGSLQRL